MQICRGFTDAQWNGLQNRLICPDGTIQSDESAWRCAIEVFERRIRERFLSSIEALEKADSRSDIEEVLGAPSDCSSLPDDSGKEIVVPGFAVVGLCCLLIEALQAFREAPVRQVSVPGPCTYPAGSCIRPQTSTTDAFMKFLRLPAFQTAFEKDEVAKSFIHGVRNGILHEAETRRWVIWREEPANRIVESEGDGYALNRTLFYRAIKSEFDTYIRKISDLQNGDLRKCFVKKMHDIVDEC
jgi:hypothetical protein